MVVVTLGQCRLWAFGRPARAFGATAAHVCWVAWNRDSRFALPGGRVCRGGRGAGRLRRWRAAGAPAVAGPSPGALAHRRTRPGVFGPGVFGPGGSAVTRSDAAGVQSPYCGGPVGAAARWPAGDLQLLGADPAVEPYLADPARPGRWGDLFRSEHLQPGADRGCH